MFKHKNGVCHKKLNTDDYKGASDQFTVWNKGVRKVLQDIVNRRAKEKVFLVRNRRSPHCESFYYFIWEYFKLG